MLNRTAEYFGGAMILVLLLVLGGCAELTTVREHPEFASQTRKIARVAILPPEVEYTRLVFTGDNERDPKQERSIAATLVAVSAPGFRERGYTVSETDIRKQIAEDPDLAYELEQLRNAYNTAAQELYDGKSVSVEDSAKFKVTLGPMVNLLADRADADGLVLMRYSGFSKSDGLMNKERLGNALLAGLTGVYYEPARTGGALEIALIDGTTGEVLWCNVAGQATVGSGMILSQALKPLRRIGPPTHKTASTVAETGDEVRVAETSAQNAPIETEGAALAQGGAPATSAPEAEALPVTGGQAADASVNGAD